MPAPGSERTVTVESDAESMIARPTFWDGECRPRPFKAIITRAPTNGTAWVKVGPNTVSAAGVRSGTAGRCVGREVIGKQIMYRSNAGFHGSDVVSYEIVGSNRRETYSTTVTIEVR
jgi:hypothetical protein